MQACRKPLFLRGNLFADSIRWLKGSDLVFSAVKQRLPQWDENREEQKRFSSFGEPSTGEKLGVSGAAAVGPSRGSGSAPHGAAGCPQVPFSPLEERLALHPSPKSPGQGSQQSLGLDVAVVGFHPPWCMKELTH